VLVPFRLTPHVNYVVRNIFGNIPLKTMADRQEVLCQDEVIKVPPAIFLPGQLERVTATDPGTTIELEVSTATSEVLRSPPTIAHYLSDVILIDGSIYKGRYKSFISARSFFKTQPPPPEPLHLKTIGLASSHFGNRYFGHWLIDDCTQYRLAEQHGRPLCMRGPIFPHHQQTYQTYLGQDWTPIDRAFIDQLIVYQDFHWGTAQDSLRGAHIRSMRQRARAMLPSGGGKSLVYLRRGTTGARRPVQNEVELLDILTRRGFLVVDLDSGSLEQILNVLANAKIVVSMEGSQATHCAYAIPDNSGLLLLEPPDRFLTFHRGWTASAGVEFGFVVGSSSEGGYTFSPSEVLHTVDLMMRAVDRKTSA
jgi:Glycosyltransferase 61